MDIEGKPNFLGLARVPYTKKESTFMKCRRDCDEMGFTLERLKRGYVLLGRDLGAAGVMCRNIEEVEDELDNYR